MTVLLTLCAECIWTWCHLRTDTYQRRWLQRRRLNVLPGLLHGTDTSQRHAPRLKTPPENQNCQCTRPTTEFRRLLTSQTSLVDYWLLYTASSDGRRDAVFAQLAWCRCQEDLITDTINSVKPNTHRRRRRRRDETVLSRRVGGVYMIRTHNTAVGGQFTILVTTADGCVHTDDMTKLSPTSCEFVYTLPTRRDSTVSSRRRRRCVLGLTSALRMSTLS